MRFFLFAVVLAALGALIYTFVVRPRTGGTATDSRTSAPENPPVVEAVQSSLRDAAATAHLKEMLAAGSDPNALDVSGRPVLSLAVRNNDTGAAEALLAKGADVNKRDHEQWTPLMTAAFQAARDPKAVPMVKLLLAHGADANASKEGTTALHVAVNNLPETAKDAPVIEALLTGGAKPDGVPGSTAFTMPPLQLAAWNGKTAAALALARGGASLAAPPSGGKPAAQTARDHGHPELAGQLEKLVKKNTK